MHSASSRFNSVVVFSSTILVLLCAINFAHGYYLVRPQLDNVEVRLALRDPHPFVDTRHWDQAAFRYDLYTGTPSLMQIYRRFTTGTSSSSSSSSSSSGLIPSPTYLPSHAAHQHDDCF
jgi:hypothetical protein